MDEEILVSEDKGGELGSLPILNSQEVGKWVHVRLNHLGTLDAYYDFLKKSFKKFVVCIEKPGTPQQHFHAVFEWDKKLEDIGDFLRTYDSKIKGNKSFSSSWMKGENLFAYVVKESIFKFEGFSKKEIEIFQKKSYLKYSKEEFAKKLNKITDEYLTTEGMHISKFIYMFIQLKVEYKQVINENYIQQYATMVMCKKNPMAIYTLSEKIKDKMLNN